MWPFKKKNRHEILSEEIQRFKRRVIKRFGMNPFVKPETSWYKAIADGIEWNDVHVLLFFSSDEWGVEIEL